MSKRVRWTAIEEELNELGKPGLLRLLKELHDAVSEVVRELEAQIGEASE